MKEIIERQDNVSFDRAHLKSIDQSALEFDVVYQVQDPAYAVFIDRQQAVLLESTEVLAELGVSTLPVAQQVMVFDDSRAAQER